MSPCLDRCVCFGLLFTSDDDLGSMFILPYGAFSSADASYLLFSVNGLLHVDLKPSIYGRAACIWSECMQLGDCLSHSLFQQMYVHSAAERFFVRNAYASPSTCTCSRSCTFCRRKFRCRPGAFTRFRLFVPYRRDIASFWTALWPYGRDTE